MAKRLKTVFSSHSQLAHVWAQQTQERGRASRMFFENTTDAYSYGYHYLAAKIYTAKRGAKFALIRSDAYSTSTAGHLSDLRRAVQGLMPSFNVPGSAALNNPREAVKALDLKVMAAIDMALGRKFFADSKWMRNSGESERQSYVESIQGALNTANELRKILGMAPKSMPKKYSEALKHLDKLVEKYNSPDRVAKRETKANERETERVRRAKESEKDTAERLENFRAGKNFDWIRSDYDLLRIKGDLVETSGGAEVPLKAARALYAAIKSGRDVLGLKIGDFTLVGVTQLENGDKAIKIGCHNILLSEATALFGGGNLQLVAVN